MISHGLRAVALLLLMPLAGCTHRAATRPGVPASNVRYSQAQDSGPGAAPDISKIPEPTPKSEPLSQYGNKSPYSVLGETYRVLPSAKGYAERGIASWYGEKFHGHMTSTFEPYDMYSYSGAHKTLPLPCYARVTNLENGNSAVVRINDRGPFKDNRIIDLSFVAAVKLGIWQKGTGLVEVRAIDPDHPNAEPEAAPVVATQANSAIAAPQETHKPQLFLQVGAYAERANAERAVAVLQRAHFEEVHMTTAWVNAKTVHRVRLGPLSGVDEADRLAPAIRRLGLGTPRVAVDD